MPEHDRGAIGTKIARILNTAKHSGFVVLETRVSTVRNVLIAALAKDDDEGAQDNFNVANTWLVRCKMQTPQTTAASCGPMYLFFGVGCMFRRSCLEADYKTDPSLWAVCMTTDPDGVKNLRWLSSNRFTQTLYSIKTVQDWLSHGKEVKYGRDDTVRYLRIMSCKVYALFDIDFDRNLIAARGSEVPEHPNAPTGLYRAKQANAGKRRLPRYKPFDSSGLRVFDIEQIPIGKYECDFAYSARPPNVHQS